MTSDEGTPAPGGSGFFDKILGLFFGLGDPQREKRRQVKNLAKTFSRDKYKFYRPRTGEILGAFGKFYYEIYKITSGVNSLIQKSETEGALKVVAIQSHLSEQQIALLERLSEKSIRERARGAEARAVVDEVKRDLVAFVGTFDGERIGRINTIYNQLRAFVEFCSYDFYFTLRMFDSAISEGTFSYKPRFEPINAEYVIDNIRDFIESAGSLPPDTDWNALFDVIQSYRGVDPVNRDSWRKVARVLFEVLGSEVLLRMVRHATEDPFWKPSYSRYDARIVQPYLDQTKAEAEQVLKRIADERKNSKIEQLVQKVFGTTAVARARNYTEKANLLITKRNETGFLHTAAYNYLKAYLIDLFKRDVREVAQDILIVRGKWTTNVHSQQLSDAYHAMLSVSQQVVAFDDGLADEGDTGQRLRKAMSRVIARDPSSGRPLREVLNEVNGQALNMINEAAQNLIVIGKIFKQLIEDVDRKDHEMIINWKELNAMVEEEIKTEMSTIYRQMYYMVQLLQVYVKRSG